MFTIGFGSYQLLCCDDSLPVSLGQYFEQAAFVDQIDLRNPDGKFCFIAVKRASNGWPSLVVAQRYESAAGVFFPGALLVPETDRLFIGAGTRLLCYDISKPARIWEDATDLGFWSWTHDCQEVFMAAEIEFAAFDTSGAKLWTRFIEPPWNFTLEFGHVVLDVMGSITKLDRRTGDPV